MVIATLVLGAVLLAAAIVGLRWRSLWIGRVFAVEFGQSDLQGNYSRTYSWMANQLGHVTLGLGSALAVYWAIEVLGATFAALDPRPAGATFPPGTAPDPLTPPHPAYAWATIVVLGLVLGANLGLLSGRPSGPAERRLDLPETARRRGLWQVAGLALALTGAGLILAALFLRFDPWGGLAGWFAGVGGVPGSLAATYAQDSWVAIGSAGLGLSIWLTKEFCSDQGKLGRALAAASAERSGEGSSAGPETRARLLREGWWDSATDGFFYVTGAVVASGILASHPTARTGFVESGMEILSLLLLGVVFLRSGARYSFRQQAMDRIGAPYSERLALLGSALRRHLPAPEPGVDLIDEMLGLAARPASEPGQSVHLVVVGRPGSGKTPFVVSLATEAALAPIPPEAWSARPEPGRVRARYTIFHKASLSERLDRIHRRRDDALGGQLTAEKVVLAEGRVLNELSFADVAVIDNIPHEEAGALAAGGGRLGALADAFCGREGRFVWALDPPDLIRPAMMSAGRGGEGTGSGQAGAPPDAEIVKAGRRLLNHLEARVEAAGRAAFRGALVEVVRTAPGRSGGSDGGGSGGGGGRLNGVAPAVRG